MAALWNSATTNDWHDALHAYPAATGQYGGARLTTLDDWYARELPVVIASRSTQHVTHDELVRLTEWKMARGAWRAPNLVLVRGNASEVVMSTSQRALVQAPHPRRPIATLATLAGVGPATASAVMAIAHPTVYPFFDELVAAQVPELGAVAWTLPYYVKYADALRARALELGEGWTPVMVERAVWANAQHSR